MGVAYAADGIKASIKLEVSRCIRGWIQLSFELVAVKVEQDDLFRDKVVIGDAAGLNGYDAGGAVYCAYVAPAIDDEVVAW